MWDAENTCPFLEYATECILYHAEFAHSPDTNPGDSVAAFPHDLWPRFYNLMNPRSRLSVGVSSLYLLVLEGALKLADAYIKAKEMPRQWSRQVLPEHHRSFLGPAVHNDDEAMAKMLLGHGIGANWPAIMDHTCLSLAVEKQNDRMVQILIDAGATADPQANESWGSAQLGKCLRSTSQEVAVKVLMSAVYKSRWHEDFHGTLHHAKDNKYHTVEQVLLSRLRASVEEAEAPGQASPIEPYRDFAFMAACIYDLPEIITPLVKHGVDLNGTYRGMEAAGKTGLSHAIHRCHPRVIKALLEAGADPNVPNDLGDFPIHEAARRGCEEILRTLLESGADPPAADGGQARPLHRTAIYSNNSATQLPVVHRANVNARNRRQETPLHVAATYGRQTFVRLLLDHGADVHASDGQGKSAIVRASDHGDLEVVDMLLEAGDPVPIEQLNYAAYRAFYPRYGESRGPGHAAVIERLVQKGAKRTGPQ